jgi:hypothetical protein
MPVEIKELHIRVTLTGNPPAAAAPREGGGTQGQDAIVAECVEQVLQILQAKRER